MSAQSNPLAVVQRAILDLSKMTTAPATIPVNTGTIANAFCKEIAKNDRLAACSVDSMKQAFVEAVTYGLVPGLLGQCYLVPFKNKRGDRWVMEATLMIGYQGMLDMMHRDGSVLDCSGEVVYSKDHFRLRKGDRPGVDHDPTIESDRGEMLGAYVVAHLRDAPFPRVEWMPKSEIDKVEAASTKKNGGKQSPAWRDWYDEMAKKTVLRRALKTLPLSVDLMKVFEGQMTAEFGEQPFSVEQRPSIEMPRRKSEALPPPAAANSSPTVVSGEPPMVGAGAHAGGAPESSSDRSQGKPADGNVHQPAEGEATASSAQPQGESDEADVDQSEASGSEQHQDDSEPGPPKLSLKSFPDEEERDLVRSYLASQVGPAEDQQNAWLAKCDVDRATLLDIARDHYERTRPEPSKPKRNSKRSAKKNDAGNPELFDQKQ